MTNISVDKERLLNLWACLVMNDLEEAYNQLYQAESKSEGANPYDAFATWWTQEEEQKAYNRMRKLIGG